MYLAEQSNANKSILCAPSDSTWHHAKWFKHISWHNYFILWIEICTYLPTWGNAAMPQIIAFLLICLLSASLSSCHLNEHTIQLGAWSCNKQQSIERWKAAMKHHVKSITFQLYSILSIFIIGEGILCVSS